MKQKRLYSKKGFTLIELLAVITILAIIMLLAARSVTSILSSSQKKSFVIDAQNIVESAKHAYNNYLLNNQINGTSEICFSIAELRENGLEKFEDVSGSVLIDATKATSEYTIWLSNGQLQINGIKTTDLTEDFVESYQMDASTTCSNQGGSTNNTQKPNNNNNNNETPNTNKNPKPGNNSGGSVPNYPIEPEPVLPTNEDNTLKSVIVDGNNLPVTANMEYITSEENIDIEVVPNNENATYEIKNNTNLYEGKNLITIVVKAQSGATRRYKLSVTREIVLSSDTNIQVYIDNKEVNFVNDTATLDVDSSKKTISLDYRLSSPKAKAEVSSLGQLKAGVNELKIKVIAENGEEKTYTIIINKEAKDYKTMSIILIIVPLALIILIIIIKNLRK